MDLNSLSYIIKGCFFEVYNNLGPGLLESVYEKALEYELLSKELNVKTQVPIPVIYKNDVKLDLGFRLDILVNNAIIIEIKSVEELNKVHFKQLLTYLKLTKLKLGYLINFNTDDLNNNTKRIVNNL